MTIADELYDRDEDAIREGIAVGDLDDRGRLLDDDGLCPHDDLRSTCPPCRRLAGKSNRLPDDDEGGRLGRSRPFAAKVTSGTCFGCPFPIVAGQSIVYSGNGYAHVECESGRE